MQTHLFIHIFTLYSVYIEIQIIVFLLSKFNLGLPWLLLPSTMMLTILLIGALKVFLCTCSNHLNLYSCIFTKIGATHSFSLNSRFLILSIIVLCTSAYEFLYFHLMFKSHLYGPTYFPIQQIKPKCKSVKFTF